MERTTLHALSLLAACLIVCLIAACRPPCGAEDDDLIQSVGIDAGRRLEKAPDMAYLATAPDLAPRACIFDRECGDKARCCGGRCVAPDDRDHCGKCGISCGSDPGVVCCAGFPDAQNFACYDMRKSRMCGGCGMVCENNTETQCCDGVCSLRQQDPLNCGTCGQKCAPGGRCRNGRCEL